LPVISSSLKPRVIVAQVVGMLINVPLAVPSVMGKSVPCGYSTPEPLTGDAASAGTVSFFLHSTTGALVLEKDLRRLGELRRPRLETPLGEPYLRRGPILPRLEELVGGRARLDVAAWQGQQLARPAHRRGQLVERDIQLRHQPGERDDQQHAELHPAVRRHADVQTGPPRRCRALALVRVQTRFLVT
jgi:hypothetical protein